MMSATATLVVFGLCLVFCALFSGAEIALVSADRAALIKHARNHGARARLAERFLERPHWFLAAALSGTTLSISLGVVSVTLYSMSLYGTAGALLAFVIAAPLLIVFGRIMPRMYFLAGANRNAPAMLLGLGVFSWITAPLQVLVVALMKLVEAVSGRGRETGFWYTREELKHLLTEASQRESLDDQGRLIIDRIFEFSKSLVEEVMIPLVEVEAIEDTAAVVEVMRKISQTMYSRYPVYHERIDNVVGALDSISLLEADDLMEPVREWVVPVRYVPYNRPVDELLFEMQRHNFDFAVVVDEYGGCAGIITREDILEEIVGEIEDEHDQPAILYRRLGGNRLVINARMEIEDANQFLGWDLPKGDYETVGGFLLSLFRRVPAKGERILYRDLVFTVSEATPRTVQEVEVEEKKELTQKRATQEW